MPKRAVLYARVSSDDTRNEGRNLEGQLDMCREYAESNGWSIVAELAEDDRGARGTSFDLPQLSKLREMAKAGEFDILVVREIDRLSRKLSKQLVVEEELQRHGVQIEYVLGEYPNTPEGDMLKYVKAIIAEYERAKIEERMTRGRRLKAKSGQVVLHGRAPYGYRKAEQNDKVMLEICESEAKVVRLVFSWYVYGDENRQRMTLGKIVKRLNQMGVPTYADKHEEYGLPKTREWGKWNRTTIRNMLRNETYAGVWHYGKRNFNGDHMEVHPEEHRIAVSVPAIVERELWEAAQEQIEYNKRHAKRNLKYEYLLRLRLTCADCGSSMVTNSKRSSKKVYLYYRCQAKGNYADDSCSLSKYFRADKLDQRVWEWVKSFLTDRNALRKGLEAYQIDAEQSHKPLQERLSVIEAQLERQQNKSDRLMRLYLSEKIDEDTWLRHKAELDDKLETLEREKQSLRAKLDHQGVTEDQIETIEEFAQNIATGLEAAENDFETRRRIIEGLEVYGTLGVEDGERVAYMQCLLGEAVFSAELTSSRSSCAARPARPACHDAG